MGLNPIWCGSELTVLQLLWPLPYQHWWIFLSPVITQPACKLRKTNLAILYCLLSKMQRASYLLVVYFHTYENSLHSFANTSSSPIEARCCDGQGNQNCTEPCNTILNYCFKESGTVNNFTNDDTILADCVGDTRSSTELVEAMDKIDFSDPPLTINGIATWKSIANRGDIWLVNNTYSTCFFSTSQEMFVLCQKFFL